MNAIDVGAGCALPRRAGSGWAFPLVSAVLLAGSGTVTTMWCASMSSMPEMAMPGGWTMSMTWMRMPGQTWPGAAAQFVGMWAVMMLAMMLPVLMPMLIRYREAVRGAAGPRLGRLTLLAGAAYFLAWMLCGVAVFALGVTLAEVAMQSAAWARAVPIAAGLIVLLAGATQFTAWKRRQLACCRQASSRGTAPADDGTAFRHGLRLGLHCIRCCAGLTAMLLVGGVMELRVMAFVTAAVGLERLAPAGVRCARAIGVLLVGVGIFMIVRAA